MEGEHNNSKDNASSSSSTSVKCILLPPSLPLAPSLRRMLIVKKHTWLQHYQAYASAQQGSDVSRALARARDFYDPTLRDRWHIVVDTNVMLEAAIHDFEFFRILEGRHKHEVVIIVPAAAIEELDQQKDNDKHQMSPQARQASRYISSLMSASSSFLTLQSMDEDRINMRKHASGPQNASVSYNLRNDRRMVECTNVRYKAGLKAMFISNDVNACNLVKGLDIPAFSMKDIFWILNKRPNARPGSWGDLVAEHKQYFLHHHHHRRRK